jgi:CubicO group peptidase (beta-lactamase class C family)
VNPEGLRAIERVFHEQLAAGLHAAAQLVVMHRGEIVVDLAGGWTRPGVPATSDSLFLIFSATKPWTAMAVHLLAERGRLQLADAVARYWPGFAQSGKERVTIAHVLSHRGGFPLGPGWLTWEKWGDWPEVVRAMETVRLRWPPGTTVAYHPLNFGWVLGELVRRVDGRRLGQFLHDEFWGPLRLQHTFLGLPETLAGQVAHITDHTGKSPFVADFNRAEVQRAEVPAGGGITTARELARFYALLAGGDTLDGTRVFAPDTICAATRPSSEGEIDVTLQLPMRWAFGFHLGGGGSTFGTASSPAAFGHAGHGSTLAWADPGHNLAFAMLTNGVQERAANYRRFVTVSDAVLAACA